MAAAPARRRPGATSPIPRLEPHVEAVKTPASTPAPAARTVEVTPVPTVAPPVAAIPAPVIAQPTPERKAVTFPMSIELKKRVETAVLRAQGHPGGYGSFTAFMDGAATRELARLEAEYNGGEAFEPNPGRLRAGRPIG